MGNHTDTLLLAEIMMGYRKVIQDNFEMDINHFLGIPGLSFNLMLKISKVKLELISDPEMSDFFRKSIRGGMSFIATRNAKSDYTDSNIENCNEKMNHIRYIDGNNLYGSQMLFDLPTEDYKFENQAFIQKIEKKLKNKKTVEINKRGMFLEVGLDYLEETHKLHKDFPLAPERYNVPSNELSPIIQFLYNKMKNGNQKSTYCEEKID